jgi:hypothetical protein
VGAETKKPALRCSKCGTVAAGELLIVAKPGGTHYQTRTREKEARKTEGRHSRATSCGTWMEVTDAG